MTAPVLQVAGVTVTYGGVTAVGDVSFEVGAGQLVGLIGPNGAGKTSLIDAMCGFTPYRGSVLLAGEPLEGLSAQRRNHRGISRTWQTADLLDELTVAENLALAAQRRGWPSLVREVFTGKGHPSSRARAEEVLAQLGLEQLAGQLPDSLSQGQRKLVDVARAVVGSAVLLCLDEPAAGLDSQESALLGGHLRDIVGGGRGMLLVDHDMGLVLSVCDHIVVLDFGRVIAQGPPQQIRADPKVIDAYIGSEHQAPDGVDQSLVSPEVTS